MTTELYDETTANTIADLIADRWLAHTLLFPHRHTEASAPAHARAVDLLHSRQPRHCLQAFRGFGKSTLVEETIVIQAALREFRNKLIIGSSYDRACERLAAIKREIDQNEQLEILFGRLRGSPWGEGKIVLASGICIQALGRDQNLRGTKHFDWRPDSVLVDDVEDKDEVRNPAGRERTMAWFEKEMLPGLDDPVLSHIRVLGTPMDAESLVVELEKMGWPTTKFPVEHLAEDGTRRPTWEAKFPLWKIDQIRKDYRRDMTGYRQEYMCEAVSDADRTFRPEMFRIEPRERSWQAVYAMYDPARTTNRQSATTGKAVWSWLGNRLMVWQSAAGIWKPDEIIADIFATAEEFDPVEIGFEEDGLNEWALQPLRQEQTRRRIMLPLKPVRAPRSKLDFIRGLQPFFNAREILFAEPMPDLQDQLLSFPSGRIDVPNALAYAILLRPGALIYENFSDEHIAPDLEPVPARPLWLAANATGAVTTAVLMQVVDGQTRILADWVREGSPSELAADIHAEAALEGDAAQRPASRYRGPLSDALKIPEHRTVLVRMPVRWTVPPHHAERYTNVGLEQAIRAIPAVPVRGGTPDAGRTALRASLGRLARGDPAVLVGDRATWTLRAFAGGYCRAAVKSGRIAEHAEEGIYRVLMEGIESFLAMTAAVMPDEDGDDEPNWAYDPQGRRYRSAMPARRR